MVTFRQNNCMISGQYERIFEKPMVGSKGIYQDGGVLLEFEDGVFEIVFDTYDATIGERIGNTKSIEPNEIKDYLKFNSKNFREDYYCKSSFPSGSFIRQTFSMQPRSVPPMVSKPEKN